MIALLVTVALAVLVWPTRFRYDTVTVESQERYIRFDRFTGQTDRLTSKGWQAMAPVHFSRRQPEIGDERDPLARIEADSIRRQQNVRDRLRAIAADTVESP